MPKQYPDEFKKQVTAICLAGISLVTVSKKYHISLNTLYRWRKEHQQAEDQSTTKDYLTLCRQHERQGHILQIVRLSNIIDDVPRCKRLEILARLHEQFEQYSVHELCEALNISRGTFYNHIFRRTDRTEYLQKQQELMLQVQRIFDDSQQRFGAEKIRVVLAENGIRVGKKRIRQIMQELNLISIRENAKSNYRSRQEYLKRNLVNQEFRVTRPNEIWASDITYFKVKGYAVYLCVIIDLFSRKVVGYRVSRKCSTYLVTATFKDAFRARATPQI